MGTYTQALQGLNEAQRKAVTTTEGPVLVIAGPGTGKTQLLTTRIAHILATTDTLPQNILCLTFTDSAAQTMRERLAAMIGQAAYNVTISTYHAFGSELIRRYPDYFSDEADLQPVDDLGIDGILRTIVADLPYDNPLKYSDAYLPDIKTLISDAKRALLTPDDLRAVANANLSFIATASPIVSEVLKTHLRLSKKEVPVFAVLAERLESLATSEPTDKNVLPLSGLIHQELVTALEDSEAAGKQTPLAGWKKNWLAKDNDGKFIIDGTKANKKVLAAADIYEQYLRELKARHLFDYDDMILRAVHALEQNNDLRYTLQEQYLYLLLDEFQDTNGAQLRLVELLTDNPVNEGRPNVLAVGDDDQAIYAFQGANYSHMLHFKHLYRDVLAVPLTQNYRSHADILHTARGIAEQIEERLHHHFPDIEKVLSAENKNLPPKAILERREARSDVMQYAWVTKQIKKLLASGMPASEIAVLAPKHKYLEPLVPFLQQEAIPVRYEKRENVLDDPAINQLLRMSELCLALARGDQHSANALWAEVLSFDFWNLPTSLIWRLAWQSTDDDRAWTDELLADDQLKPIALFFIRLSQLASSETLEAMLDYLVGSTALDLNEPGYSTFASPYYAHYFSEVGKLEQGTLFSGGDSTQAEWSPGRNSVPETQNANFWNLLTNLIVLRARLREYRRDGEERLLLTNFIEFVEAHRAAELKILNTSPYASGAEAVQLMTAFKSKGMEFAAVFVLAVNDQAWGSSARGAGSRLSLPQNLHFIRYAGATDDERLRLFYVAITRAKHQLYLVNYTNNYVGKTMARLRYLNETYDEHGTIYCPLLPEGRQTIKEAEDGVAAPTTELAAYWQRRHEQALSSADMHALLQGRLEQYQLSPTHLCDFIDVVNCGPHAFFLRTILRFPQAPRSEIQFGNAMHETLEWLHHAVRQGGALPNSKAIAGRFEQQLRAKRLNDHDTQQYLARGLAALEAYISQRAHTISPDNVVEYSFRGEGVFAGDAHLGGKIDKLIIDKEHKTITIVDYKTGKSHQRWGHELKLHKYKNQLYFYKLLVEGSHRFAGYTVTDAYLEFVEPDEDGVIQELHLSLDDGELDHLRKLIGVMWQRLQALDLPDISSYDASMAGVLAFEKDLISATL
jgi:DNA helicase-2/ATP-dependent DNA helicase PcrA